MVEVALEDQVIAKMYGRVVFKFMNDIVKVSIRRFVYTCNLHHFTLDGGRLGAARIHAAAGSAD